MTRDTSAQIFRFLVVGVGATLAHWGIYLLLNALLGLTERDTFALSITYSLGYAVSLLGNYLLSLKWTFRTKGSAAKGLGFLFSHAVNYGLHLLLLNLFLWLGVHRLLHAALAAVAPGLTVAPEALLPLPVFFVVVPVNFLMVRFFLTRRSV